MIVLCGQCGRPYRVEDNRADACTYHPGDVRDYDRVLGRGVGAPGDFWECCRRAIESDPFDAPGCAIGPHAVVDRRASHPALLGHRARKRRAVAAARAEERVEEFLVGRTDLGDGERWRDLFTALSTLGGIAPSALLGLLSSAEFPGDRRRELLPLVRDTAVRAAIASTLGSPPAMPSWPSGEWRPDRLFTTFPTLCPHDSRGAVSTPTGPLCGEGKDGGPREDDPDPTALVSVTIAPSPDFVIRLDTSPFGKWPPHPRAEEEAARGLLKGAVRLVTPPALACEITARVGPHNPLYPEAASDRAYHVAAYRAFQAACQSGAWTFGTPFPDVEPPTREETLEDAWDRIAGAFECAGFNIDRSQGRRPGTGHHDLLRLFRAYLFVEGGPGEVHIFFVGTDPWTSQSIAALEQDWRELGSSVMHDGYAAVRHVISAYPDPRRGA